ncbi:MAG: Asp-tRNA(Asn)/Glu-tRNA(Gln) amidotransferase subunit GatB [Gemmataceae bacterium]|nr:Asp-tRNA(Asn)/Glu-tRNA(Gln) amidotransferase subunit GatB [Gemmataceae bacterium]
MTVPYEIVVGLETHVQLLTRTKLFCGCSTAFGLPPNSATCPVCLGLPGALPVLNRRAFDLSLRAALALGCDIAPFTKWDRKNYFYPDLPKNYQISQYDLPLATGGGLALPSGKRVGLIRAHLEEDAGKLIHEEGRTLIDLNRAGTPLLEIVSQPEMSSPEEARAYLEEMALLMRQVGVSDCEMAQGSLRCDANVNLRIEGGAVTPIVEIKNLNSFRFLEKAVAHEARRQYEAWRADPGYTIGKHPKETAGWDEARGVTVFQRRKEEAADYRYFPDPDLVPVRVDEAWIERVRKGLGETPAQSRVRLSMLGLSDYDAGVLVGLGYEGLAYFDAAAQASGDPKAACNWIANTVLASLEGSIAAYPVSGAALGELIALARERGLGKGPTEQAFASMRDRGIGAKEALGGLATVDEGAILGMVRRAMEANPKAVADYRKGKAAAANALKGAVMREAKGAAKADAVERVLLAELAKEQA